MIPTAGFELRFDPQPSRDFPHGYWYAATADGNHDASGATPENALAALVIEVHKALLELEERIR